jgi:hypothetical protein
VEIVILATALVVSFGIALGVSRLLLGLVLTRMTGNGSVAGVTVHWRRVAFAAGLFWLWYLVPTLAAAATAPASLFRQLLGN